MRRLASAVAALALASLSFACAGGDHTVVAEFVDVGDLVTRANVQQSDAVVGSVRAIDLVERGERWIARVTLSLQDQARITPRTRAIVRSTSLLGEKYVDLVTPDGAGATPADGTVIGIERTAKAPELEAVFSHLGAILQTGALEDLGALTTASAMILEGQEENVGRVLDGTAKLVSSLASQKEALASALDDLAQAAGTLDGRSDTLDRALDVSDDALRVVSSQEAVLSDLIVQLDELAGPLARLTKAHKADISEQLEILNEVVPKVHEVRGTLADAVEKLPPFTELFARAAPGDYVQLDIFIDALPIGTPKAAPAAAGARSAPAASLRDVFMAVTR